LPKASIQDQLSTLTEHFTDRNGAIDQGPLRDALSGLCASAGMTCQNSRPTSQLDHSAASEVIRRLQFGNLASKLSPEEIASFTGLASADLARLGKEPRTGATAQELWASLERTLPPGAAQDLLDRRIGRSLPPETLRILRRMGVQQTAPGQGTDGAPTMPGGNFQSPGNPPVLPVPVTLPGNLGSRPQCAAPSAPVV